MYILAIEASCDETSASVVEMDDPCGTDAKAPVPVRNILSNRIASQIPLHTVYAGVMPCMKPGSGCPISAPSA